MRAVDSLRKTVSDGVDTRAGQPPRVRAVSRVSLVAMRLRSPHDREILRLALPALGALAAEPLYLLIDTAIVGHLGTAQLAGLALAVAVLTAPSRCSTSSSTGPPLRSRACTAPAAKARPTRSGCSRCGWPARSAPACSCSPRHSARPSCTRWAGAGGRRPRADLYLRIGALGLPSALIALTVQGYLRGVSRLGLPFADRARRQRGQRRARGAVRLRPALGPGRLGLGDGDRPGVMGAAFIAVVLRGARRPAPALGADRARCCTSGGDIFVRTGSLYASFLFASAVLARIGAASLGAHQVAFQLWGFLALVLDAVAIAGQVHRRPRARRRARARRRGTPRCGCSPGRWRSACSSALVMLALTDVLPRVFTSDPRVLARLHAIWPIYALMQPINAIVFALDGILIGAGDTRFLKWAMAFSALGVFVPIALVSLARTGGSSASGAACWR